MGKQAIGGGFTGQGGMRLPFPKAMRAGDFVFVSDQMATGADGQLVEGGIEAQTRQVMDNIKAVLAEAGCTMDDRLQASIAGGKRRLARSGSDAVPVQGGRSIG
jgi:enamine deaminase RidA (YjgF/YER057c/UK114 family)